MTNDNQTTKNPSSEIKPLQTDRGFVIKRGRPKKDAENPPSIRTSTVQRPIMGAPVNTDSRANRPHRIPLHQQKRIRFEARPGFVARVVNDINEIGGSRIMNFEKAGYTKVANPYRVSSDRLAKDATPMGDSGRISVGRDTHAYVMEIPEELYREDQQTKRESRRKNREAMLKPKEELNQYGKIEISRTDVGYQR